MKPGVVKCPLCGHPVGLMPSGIMKRHWATYSRPEGGFRTLARSCRGGNKRPEDVEK